MKPSFFVPVISIHSLRMEGDPYSIPINLTVSSISIHSLRMEGDCAYIEHLEII